jgi:hypothetical protein
MWKSGINRNLFAAANFNWAAITELFQSSPQEIPLDTSNNFSFRGNFGGATAQDRTRYFTGFESTNHHENGNFYNHLAAGEILRVAVVFMRREGEASYEEGSFLV